MTPPASCQQVLEQKSQSFSLAQRVLPRRLRQPAAAIYAFCRQADDAVDGPGCPSLGLAMMRGRLERLFSPSPPGRGDGHPLDDDLRRVLVDFGLRRAPFEALLEGLAWDAAGRRYGTLEDLQAYGARVASSVGIMMAQLMGVHQRDHLARACDLGLAMQLTNIARDVGEDARLGRIYLPTHWLMQGGLTDLDGWLASPHEHPAVASAVQRLLSQAQRLYRRADEGIRDLPRDCRVGIYAARLVYAGIGGAIRRRDYQTVGGRAVVSTWRKVLTILQALTARWWQGRAQRLSSLQSYAFLLAPAPPETPAPSPASRAG